MLKCKNDDIFMKYSKVISKDTNGYKELKKLKKNKTLLKIGNKYNKEYLKIKIKTKGYKKYIMAQYGNTISSSLSYINNKKKHIYIYIKHQNY